MGVVSEVTRMARGWLAVSNPGYESIISMIIQHNIFGERELVQSPSRLRLFRIT